MIRGKVPPFEYKGGGSSQSERWVSPSSTQPIHKLH